MIELWTIYTLRKLPSSRICHTDKVFMALVTTPFSWTYYVRVFPRGVGTAQTRICYDDKLFMPLVTRPFSFTMFEYSPVGWGLLKLDAIMIVCFDIELSCILSFRCEPGRGLLQHTITTLFVIKLFLITSFCL